MKKSIVDRHLKKIVGVRFPDELRTELKKVALEYKLKMNDIVVEGTREIIKQIKKKDKLIWWILSAKIASTVIHAWIRSEACGWRGARIRRSPYSWRSHVVNAGFKEQVTYFDITDGGPAGLVPRKTWCAAVGGQIIERPWLRFEGPGCWWWFCAKCFDPGLTMPDRWYLGRRYYRKPFQNCRFIPVAVYLFICIS